MTNHFFLAPNARWTGRNQVGEPIINGKLYTYQSGTSTPKATYMDYQGMSPNANPVELDGAGEANIYWEDDQYYRIVLFDQYGNQVYDQDPYPYVLNNNASPPSDVENITNIVRNPQFTFWSNSTDYINVSSSINYVDFICDDWLFGKTDADSTIEIKQVLFSLGDSNSLNYAPAYLEYSCSAIGSGTETNSNIYQRYNSVQTFSNSTVTLTFSARCGVGFSSATLTPIIYQNFGTGGSPSIELVNDFDPVNLTGAWQTYTQTITLQNVSGNTLGINGDDALILSLQFPSNIITKIDIQSVQLTQSSSSQQFDYLSQNDQYQRLSVNATKWFDTGDYKHTIATVATPGWILADDTDIGNANSGADVAGNYTKALFILIWNSILNIYCPIFNSDGSYGTRGMTAEADYDANKALVVTEAYGRVLAGITLSGGFNYEQPFSVVFGTSNFNIIFGDATRYYTGMPVIFRVQNVGGGSLPSGIAINTTYYVIYVNSTTINIASNLTNALANVPLNLGSSSTATVLMTATINPHVLGSINGEDSHYLTTPELSIHTHPNTAASSAPNATVNLSSGNTSILQNGDGNQSTLGGMGGDIDLNDTISVSVSAPAITMTNFPAGGNNAHNNLPPTLYTNIMIKL